MRHHFRPEFLNRIDDIVVFHPLQREQIRSIVDVQLTRLASRLVEKRIQLELSDAARDILGERGYDPTYGARPLRRAIQRLVLDPLAMEIIEGRVREGDRVQADANPAGDDLVFTVLEHTEATSAA
jgi:ATP-dependent Clp protease ATP-binding subunit ClpB